MKTHLAFVVLMALLALTLSGPATASVGATLAVASQPAETDSPRARIAGALRSSPVMFIQNVGQFDERALFQVRGGDKIIWLTEDGIWVTVLEKPPRPKEPLQARRWDQAAGAEEPPRKAVNIKLSFPGANPHPRIEPFDRLDTVVSYFIGNDPAKWHVAVPVWGGVRYVDLYPGVDLELRGENGQVVPRLVAHPGADLRAVRLRVEGAEEVALQPEGEDLRLSTAVGELTLPLLTVEGAALEEVSPSVWGGAAGVFEARAPFASGGSRAPAAIRSLQSGRLLYATFLGGSSWDVGYSIAVGGSGSVYVTGWTYSSDFPTTPGAFDATFNGGSYDVFVMKLNPSGAGRADLAYATFLGGSGGEWGYSISTDGSGSIYVTGFTSSFDFPTTPGAFDTTHNGGTDAFVVKLNPSGAGPADLTYATFLGGSSNDGGHGIAVDGSGGVYVTGYTYSSDFPTTPGAFDTTFNGGDYDVFVVKLNPSGAGRADLAYATFLGGSSYDDGDHIAVDRSGSVYVTGDTYSSNFPTTLGAFDTTQNGGADVFVVKLSPSGTGPADLAYATFLGASNDDYGVSIAVNGLGSIYVTGYTNSSDFPTTPEAFDTTHNGGYFDVFVAKLNPFGAGRADLAYATFLGGSDSDHAFGIAVDGSGSVYVTGYTYSSNFPTTPGAFDTTHNGGTDAFVVKLNPSGAGPADLTYATFLGGSSWDDAWDLAIDTEGTVYVAGSTFSSDFPTTLGAFDTSHNGGRDAFVAKVGAGGGVEPTVSTLMPESSAEDPLHQVVLKGRVDPKGGTVQVWFEWGESPTLSTYQITGTTTVVGTAKEVTATLHLPPEDSVGRPFYYRIAAGNPSNPQRGSIQRILILLGQRNYPPYWNKYDRLIHYYAHQAGWPAPVVKAILAHESHWTYYKDGHFNNYPERNFLYEPVNVDWYSVYKTGSTPTVIGTLRQYLLPDHPPSEWPYNRHWNEIVEIPPNVRNMDMVGRCSFSLPELGNKDPYYSEDCIRWRSAMSRTNWSRLPNIDNEMYRRLYGITNPAITSGVVSEIRVLTAQYRLASSYGLGQVVYLSHYDRLQRILVRDSPPPPEELYNPELNIQVAVDYLKELKGREECQGSGIQEGRWDNRQDWERAVRGYNDGNCNMRGYTKNNAFSNILSLLRDSEPVLAPPNFDASNILAPTGTRTTAEAGPKLSISSGEFEIDRLIADVKGVGQAQLMVLSAVVTDPDQGIDYGKLTIFTDAAGSAVEWTSPPLEGVLAWGVVLTRTWPEGGPPLIVTLWGAGAHGTRAYLFRWDGHTFQAIQHQEPDGSVSADFFGDAGVDVGGGSVATVTRDGENPLGVFHVDTYVWNASSRVFTWIGEEIVSNEERFFRIYLPLVLRNR